ncbi:uncharacterized protein LOC100501708 [Zea mays]|uniref:Uncharacterized protein n=1 Tax=Zea mays TaxID=4577 RepID=A0A804P4Q2_MAIZE|nr:uncharacterized protein LOC100501708 [Zea mays]|eukprot:NP_001310216.1 hypothetical protein [Zea mays]
MPLSPSGAAGGLLRRCPRAAVLPAAAAAATTARLEAMQIGGYSGKEMRGEEHRAALRQKRLKKAKCFKWRPSKGDMDSKVEAGGAGSGQVCDDAVLCSLSTASFSGLVSWQRVRTLGKVAEGCDAADPPVPRKLRSAINKRAGRFASAPSRHVKKRRHLSAISAQISSVGQETRSNGSSLFTEQEEAIADVLLSLSQVPSHSEVTADKAVADSSNTNDASTSFSKGPTKEDDQTAELPSAANELASQCACINKAVEQSNIVPNADPVAAAANQSSNSIPLLSANEQMQDLSMETAVNLPSPSKDTSINSAQKHHELQFDDSKCHPAQKPEAPLWLVNSDQSEGVLLHEREKAKNNSAQEIVPLVQTLLPCTPAGYLVKPSSSKLAAPANTISESANFTTPGNQNKHPVLRNVGAPKAWKRSITHVYVSHVIQMHVNKEKAAASSSLQSQARPEERLLARCPRPPNGSSTTSHKAAAARDERLYTVHFDVRVPAHQPPAGICDAGAGRQKIVSGSSWQNLPATSAAAAAAAQHVRYLHPQMARPPATPRDATPYSFPHFPYSRGSLPPAAALQQMPQYVCGPAYGLRPASSSAMMMKQLQQPMPTQQQHQQMWQYHVSQYQPRPDATLSPAAAWHGISSSLRPMGMLAPPEMPSPPRPPQMELFCAPYQGGRQPQQLRLM